jgi:agmatinase
LATGDAVTNPSASAVADAYGRGKVGLLHFNAHADTGGDTWGNVASHATPMRRLIGSGAIPGRNFVQIGQRSCWPKRETFEWT